MTVKYILPSNRQKFQRTIFQNGKNQVKVIYSYPMKGKIVTFVR